MHNLCLKTISLPRSFEDATAPYTYHGIYIYHVSSNGIFAAMINSLLSQANSILSKVKAEESCGAWYYVICVSFSVFLSLAWSRYLLYRAIMKKIHTVIHEWAEDALQIRQSGWCYYGWWLITFAEVFTYMKVKKLLFGWSGWNLLRAWTHSVWLRSDTMLCWWWFEWEDGIWWVRSWEFIRCIDWCIMKKLCKIAESYRSIFGSWS